MKKPVKKDPVRVKMVNREGAIAHPFEDAVSTWEAAGWKRVEKSSDDERIDQ